MDIKSNYSKVKRLDSSYIIFGKKKKEDPSFALSKQSKVHRERIINHYMSYLLVRNMETRTI